MKSKTFVLPIILAFILSSFIPIDLTGKWKGYIKIPNSVDSIAMSMNLVQHKDIFTGTLTGPDGTIDIDSGIVQGSKFSFVFRGMRGLIKVSGNAYTDSLGLDFPAPKGQSRHINLIKQN